MQTQQQNSPAMVVIVEGANDLSLCTSSQPPEQAVCIAKGQNSVLSRQAAAGKKKANRTTKLFAAVARKQSSRRSTTEPTEDISNSTSSTAFFSVTGDLTEDELDVSSGGSSSSRSDSRSEQQRGGCLKIRTQRKSLARRYGKQRTTTTTTSTSTPPSTRSVSWNTIQINTHEVVLGENPAVSVGPPLSLGWALWHTERLSIDDYEAHRPERRRSDGLRIPRGERERLLMQEFGVARSYLLEMTQRINKIKMYRRVNAKRGPLEAMQDAFKNRRSVTGRRVHEKP